MVRFLTKSEKKERKNITVILVYFPSFVETLRKYSVAPLLTRTCVKEYQIPGTNQIIEKGVEVFVPVFSLHRDDKYYENPLEFNPNRFNEIVSEGKNQLNQPYYPVIKKHIIY